MSDKRDEIRKRFFGSRNFKSKIIEIFGVEVEVRQMSLGDTIKLMKDHKDMNLDAVAQALINIAYVPGTDEKVFDKTDLEGIMANPMGDWVRKVMDTLAELIGEVDAASAEKNSNETSSDS